MKRRKIFPILAAFLLTLSTFVACKEKAPAGFYYTCPMHAEVHKTEKAPCPICNMDLILKKEGDTGAAKAEKAQTVPAGDESGKSKKEK